MITIPNTAVVGAVFDCGRLAGMFALVLVLMGHPGMVRRASCPGWTMSCKK